jgi:hypothetical protein
MAFRQTMQRLAGDELLRDLALELDTVTAVRRHGLSTSENPVGLVKLLNPICPPSGAHSTELSDFGPALTPSRTRRRNVTGKILTGCWVISVGERVAIAVPTFVELPS